MIELLMESLIHGFFSDSSTAKLLLTDGMPLRPQCHSSLLFSRYSPARLMLGQLPPLPLPH